MNDKNPRACLVLPDAINKSSALGRKCIPFYETNDNVILCVQVALLHFSVPCNCTSENMVDISRIILPYMHVLT